MSQVFSKLILNRKSEKAFRNSRHPWIFSGAIYKIEGEVKDGDCLEIWDSLGLVGYGIYEKQGRIPIRIFQFVQEGQQIDFFDKFYWRNKFENAFNLRSEILDFSVTNSYRMINSEGDFLPGLVIDIYNKVAVVLLKNLFWNRNFSLVKDFLNDKNIETIYLRKEENESEELVGTISNNENIFLENNFKFIRPTAEGQKTGFFLDQRNNRNLLRKFSKNKNILNAFSYTGGFGIYGMAGNAKRVVNVDISKQALDIAKDIQNLNFDKNLCSKFENKAEDCFHYLRNMTKDEYDLIVLDPPAFTKNKATITNASRGYKEINLQAMLKIAKNGFIFTFSCSQHIDSELFRQIIFAAAKDSKREIRVIEQLSQPSDHPIDIFHPEGEYLKGLLLFVS